MHLNKLPGPLALPIVGNLYLYKFGMFNILKYHEVLKELYAKYGPLVRQKLGNRTVVHVFEPDDVKTIFENEGKRPYVVPLQETAQLYRKKSNMSLGLGNTNGDDWWRMREGIRRFLFDVYKVRDLARRQEGLLEDVIKRLKDEMDSNGQVKDMRTLFGKWSQESSGIVCFDRRLGYLDKGETEELAKKVIAANKEVFYLSGLLKFSFPFYKYFPTPKWIRLEKAEDIITKTTLQHLEETYEEIEKLKKENDNKLPEDRFQFLSHMLKQDKLTRKDIATIILSVHTDGLSTTVPALLFSLYCLAIHPKIQEKAYKELKSLGEQGKEGQLLDSAYVRAAIKESFRLFPIGTETSRILDKDLILSGYQIPKGTEVNINMSVHFKSDKYFTNATEFLPERWLGPQGAVPEKKSSRFVLMPFGLGIRTCAGRMLADQDLTMIISKILLEFQLDYPKEEKPVTQIFNSLLFPDRNPPIRFISRS